MELVDLVRYVWRHPLNASAKTAALARVARWQLASRLMNAPVALPFVDGTFLFASRGMTGATGNWYCGLHEVHEMAFVLHALREGDHFVDIGANIGSYTVLAAGAARARVTAFEPIPTTFAHLERNVALNNLAERVTLHRLGLSDRTAVLKFTSGLDTVNHVLAEGETSASLEVPVRTLDEIIGEHVPVLMKVDVEGHERSVLLGAEQTLADPRLLAVVMETNGSGQRYGYRDDELVAIMRHHGFGKHGYDPFARRLVEAGAADGNTFFVRNPKEIERRVRAAPLHKLVNATI